MKYGKMYDILDVPFGTRYVGYYSKGTGNQIPVQSYREIKRIVDEHLSINNLAISVSTYKDGKPHLLFLPFDFDSNDLWDAWKDAKKLYNHFVSCNYGTFITFSGRKGFHVFLSTEPKFYSKKQVRSTQKLFRDMLNLKTLDEQIFGDTRRLMRIPWTYNINGDVCRILNKQDGISLNIDEIYIDNYTPIERELSENEDYHDYPCIEHIIRDDIEPRHLIRFTYVILRLSDGWSYEKILDEIESFGWVDFNEDYTLKQIEHIDGRGYIPPSCETLKELGYCVVENCPYLNGINLEEVGIE